MQQTRLQQCARIGHRGLDDLTHQGWVEGLEAGDVGTIVHVYRDGQACEVEFVALDGQTRAVATVEADQVRPVSSRDMTHARQIQMA